MKTTHTPGPWHFNGESVLDKEGRNVCTKNNGPLIASAPELLATLEKVLTVTVKAAEYMSPDANVDALLHEAYALLTKATQSQP